MDPQEDRSSKSMPILLKELFKVCLCQPKRLSAMREHLQYLYGRMRIRS